MNNAKQAAATVTAARAPGANAARAWGLNRQTGEAVAIQSPGPQ